MKTIGDLWEASGKVNGLKVRWNDWGHKHVYFVIDGWSEGEQVLTGTLDNGDRMTYKLDSRHWKLYEEGDEDCAKAV